MSVTSPPASPFDGVTAAELAERHGLKPIGVRPAIGPYIASVWRRRQFIRVLASSRALLETGSNYLGHFWAVLNPVMNALVYVLIFGYIIGTDRGLGNVVGFIVVGTFVYRFFSEAVSDAARSIPRNLNLVRSLHFPRAVLPMSAVTAQLASLVPAIAVMALFVWLSDRFLVNADTTPNWNWLLIVPAVVLTYLFSMGAGFILARLCAGLPDLLNLLPFLLRLGMYASGVLFSIDHYVHNEALAAVMAYQPVAIYLDLARQALLVEESIPLDLTKWLWGAGWAVALLVVGFVFFWRDEARYGRE